MLSYAVLVIAGLLAGMINAIAGGGTLLSFPALVWLGALGGLCYLAAVAVAGRGAEAFFSSSRTCEIESCNT